MRELTVSIMALTLLAACSSQDRQTSTADTSGVAVAPGVAPGAAAAPAPELAGAPTDAQIAQIVLTANSADSAAGVLAESKGSMKSVRDFGRQMAADHGAVNKHAVELATKLGLTPEQSPTSQSLKDDGDQNMQKLQGLSGAAFDRAYVDHEVALHQQVLDALDQTLLPNAQNAELRALLEKGRPIFQGHLDMARKIQASLGAG